MTTLSLGRGALVAALLAGAAALLLLPSAAAAHGELQENRFFVGGGPAIFAPASDELGLLVDASPGLMLEGGYIFAFGPDRGWGHFGLAPTVSLRLYDLADSLDGLERRSTWAAHVGTGVKAGFIGRGAFVYGLADVGVAATEFRVCAVKGACDSSRSEADPVTRLGGGIDFSLNRWVAVGGSVAMPVIYSRDGRGIDETAVGFETSVYGKLLFPGPGKKLDVAVRMPEVEIRATD